MTVPQQSNAIDCGVHAIATAELLVDIAISLLHSEDGSCDQPELRRLLQSRIATEVTPMAVTALRETIFRKVFELVG